MLLDCHAQSYIYMSGFNVATMFYMCRSTGAAFSFVFVFVLVGWHRVLEPQFFSARAAFMFWYWRDRIVGRLLMLPKA